MPTESEMTIKVEVSDPREKALADQAAKRKENLDLDIDHLKHLNEVDERRMRNETAERHRFIDRAWQLANYADSDAVKLDALKFAWDVMGWDRERK